MQEKLSQKKAETTAAFLREKGYKIAASRLRWRTPIEAARMALGNVPEKQVNRLAMEICDRVGIAIMERETA